MTFLQFFLIWPLVPVSGLRYLHHCVRKVYLKASQVRAISTNLEICGTSIKELLIWVQETLFTWQISCSKHCQDCRHHQRLDNLISMKLHMRNLYWFHCKSCLKKLCTFLGLLCEILNKFYKNNMLGHFIHGFKHHWWVNFFILFWAR